MLKRAVLLCEEVRCDEITNHAQVKTAEKFKGTKGDIGII